MTTKRRESRTRPYTHTPDTILDEPWDNDVLAFVQRLSALLHVRWRTSQVDGKEACRALIGPSDLMKVSGKRRPDVALTLARRAADVVSMSVERRGDVYEIIWPKWLETQRLAGKQEDDKGQPSGTSESGSESASRIPSDLPTGERSSARSPWLNLLAKEPGSEAEKQAFLEAELPVIEAEAEAACPRDRKAKHAKTRSLILRWYRQRRRNPGGPPPRNGSYAGQKPVTPAWRLIPDHERVPTPLPEPVIVHKPYVHAKPTEEELPDEPDPTRVA